MPVSLDQILASTRDSLPALRLRARSLEREARAAPDPPSFAAALRSERVAVIAEVKRRSPSAGMIRGDLDPAETLRIVLPAGTALIVGLQIIFGTCLLSVLNLRGGRDERRRENDS